MLSSQPKFLKAGIVLLDPETGDPVSAIPLLYNPPRLTFTFEPKSLGAQQGRAEPLRLNGPPVETITLEAKLDAADALERGDQAAMDYGIGHYLAALQSLISPTRDQLLENNARAKAGKLTILPMAQPLPLFVWGTQRTVPIRMVSLSTSEDFFSPQLKPLQATATISMQVLTVDDLGFDHPGSGIYLTYLKGLEDRAAVVTGSASHRLFSAL